MFGIEATSTVVKFFQCVSQPTKIEVKTVDTSLEKIGRDGQVRLLPIV